MTLITELRAAVERAKAKTVAAQARERGCVRVLERAESEGFRCCSQAPGTRRRRDCGGGAEAAQGAGGWARSDLAELERGAEAEADKAVAGDTSAAKALARLRTSIARIIVAAIAVAPTGPIGRPRAGGTRNVLPGDDIVAMAHQPALQKFCVFRPRPEVLIDAA
jgi:hypothetical protein